MTFQPNSSIARIAVVGAGQIGKRHIEVCALGSNTRLTAIVDRTDESKQLAAQHGVQHCASLEALLNKVSVREIEVDGIVLATPNQLHVAQGLACMEAGIAVFIEKPLAIDVAGGQQLLSAQATSGVPVLVGHHRQHSAVMRTALEVLQSGRLGRLVAVQGSILFYKADNEGYYTGANEWRTRLGAGPILLNMIHEIGNMRALCGDITAVQAFTSNATRGFEVEDSASICLRFKNGALGTFIVSDTAASNRSWEHTSGEDPRFALGHTDTDDCYHLAGTMGSLSVPTMRLSVYEDEPSRSWHKALDHSQLATPFEDPLANQMAHFGEVALGLAQPIVSVRDGLQNLVVIEAIEQSAKLGQTVFID